MSRFCPLKSLNQNEGGRDLFQDMKYLLTVHPFAEWFSIFTSSISTPSGGQLQGAWEIRTWLDSGAGKMQWVIQDLIAKNSYDRGRRIFRPAYQ
jgi:hypothetical protein